MYISIIINLLLAAYLILTLRELKHINTEIKKYRKKEKTNKKISVDFHGKNIDPLVSEINNLITDQIEDREELNYEKQNLKHQITSISHDLRTPLTAIMGYTEILKNEEENKQKYLYIIEKKTKTLQKLVNDFYEISLLEDKNYNLELEPLYPSYILEETIMDYIDELEKKNIKLEINIEEDEEKPIDPSALRRSFHNILSNIKQHGKEKAYIYHGKENGKLITKIKNIPENLETLEPEKIFNKFYIGEKTRHNTSTGIGMYGTKLLLEKMNIDIKAEIENHLLTITMTYK